MKLTLAEWRRAKNITQQEMATMCDVHINTYRRWEQHPEEIKVTYLDRLAQKLGVDVSDITFASK